MCQLTDVTCARHDPCPVRCARCDVLFGVEGFHVTGVSREPDRLVVEVETGYGGPPGCPVCGVVALSHGRRVHELVDAPWHGTPVLVRWRKRTWRCRDGDCAQGVFTEQNQNLAQPRALLTSRAVDWAVDALGESASVNWLARQLGCAWRTVWESVKPVLQRLDADPARFDGVAILGVDEHVWHHCPPWLRGPNQVTGMVDLTRDKAGGTKARLLDLVPGRRGGVYADWLDQRGQTFKDGVKIATLDPFFGYKNAIDDKLADAASVLDAFHVVKLASLAVDQARRRVQQDTLGHRGLKTDPLYRIRNILRSGADKLTDKQWARLDAAIAADERHQEVFVAWACYQKIRDAYQNTNLNAGLRIAGQIVDSFPTCPIPEIARLGKTLKQWRREYLGYFTTNRSSNGGVEAINGLVELHRRITRGFTNFDNYRLRMLLAAGAFKPHHPHRK